MGRAPCCDKANVKRGPWSPEEDDKLKSYIQQHGTGGNWIALPQKIGLKRCGKSCRLRWLNYLRPNIRHGGFSEEEDKIICNLFMSIGSRWSIIAAQLPGRTDNDIKNYWNTKLKKKLLGKQLRKKDSKKHSKGRKIISENQDSPSSSSYINSIPQMYTFQNLPLLQPIVIPYSSVEEPRFDDHASIRKLLISLGGKFSNDDDDNHRIREKFTAANNEQQVFSNGLMHNIPTGQNPFISTINAASTGSNNESLTAQFDHDFNAGGVEDMLHGDNVGFADLFEHVMYGNPQKLQDLEFLYDDGDGVLMNKITNDCIIPGDEETHPLVFQSTSLCNNEGLCEN